GITSKDLDAKLVAEEKTEATEHTEQLEEARLNVTYDEAYATIMAYRLSTIATYLETESKNTTNAAYKQLLDSTHGNLVPIHAQIARRGAAGLPLLSRRADCNEGERGQLADRRVAGRWLY